MSEFPLGYEKIAPVTWAYLSSLLMIGLYFKFNRTFSVRNVDLILIVLLAPGMLLVVQSDGRMRNQPVQVPTVEGPSSEEAIDADQNANDLLSATSQDVDNPIGPDAEPPFVATDAATESEASENPDLSNAELSNAELTQREKLRDSRKLRQRLKLTGYIWLFVVGVLFLIRMLFDALMTRRPLLEPNLSAGGLTFLGCSLLVFLLANVIMSPPTRADLEGPQGGQRLAKGTPIPADDVHFSRHGPGFPLIFWLPSIPTVGMAGDEDILNLRMWNRKDDKPVEGQFVRSDEEKVYLLKEGQLFSINKKSFASKDQIYIEQLDAYIVIAKLMAILAHLAVVLGIVMIGYHHFGNVKMGVGVATLYLMLPYTAQMTGRVEHVIPAALLIWAIYFYRRPLAAGMFIGLASGVVYYPLFLLPLWISFYWQRGLGRFLSGVVSMLGILAFSLIFISSDVASYWQHVKTMFGIWWPVREGLLGLWGGPLGWYPIVRLPVLVAFIALSISFTVWPAQKNLGTLLSCSSALMIATQFWHGYGGGLFMAWYLPLALLTIFRPNLEDRVALSVLGEGWLTKRRHAEKKSNLAA